MNQKLFPYCIAVLQGLAALVYLSSGNVRLFVYWGAACTLTVAVTM